MSAPAVLFSTGSLYAIDVAQCFELAAEAGFDGIEVMCDGRWSSRDPVTLQALSQRVGLPVRVIHSPFDRFLPGWQQPADQVHRITQTLALAERVGSETVVVHLPRRIGMALIDIEASGRRVLLPTRTPFRGVRRWIREELPSVQSRTTVKIAVENMPTLSVMGLTLNPFWWNTVAEWSRVHAYLTLDTTHWGTHGIDPLDAYRAAGERIVHVHLSNYDGREHRLPHQGDLDLGKLLRILAADGFEGTVSVETCPEALQFENHAALRRNLRDSLQFCREHLGQ
jgi:sugar phosphate isomerase/epimerase